MTVSLRRHDDRGVRPDFDIVLDQHPPRLADLVERSRFGRCETETVAADHDSVLKNHPVSDNAVLTNGHEW